MEEMEYRFNNQLISLGLLQNYLAKRKSFFSCAAIPVFSHWDSFIHLGFPYSHESLSFNRC